MLFSDKAKGFTGAILSGIAYGLNPLFALPLYERGFTTSSILFYRFFHAALFLAVMLLLQKKTFRLPRQMIPQMILMGMFCSLSAFTLFLSFSMLPSGIAVTLVFTCPVWVVLIHILGYREKPAMAVWAGLFLAFAGVLLLSGCDGNGSTISLAGLFTALVSGFSYAVYMVMIEKSKLKSLPTDTLTFYLIVSCFLIFAVYFLVAPCFSGAVRLQWIPDLAGYFWMLGLAFVPTFLAFWFLAVGTKFIGSAITAIIGALEPLTAVLVGIFVFHESLTGSMIAGIIVILLSVFTVIGRKTKKA